MFGSKLGKLNPLEGGKVVRASSPVFAAQAHTLPTGAQPSAPCAPAPALCGPAPTLRETAPALARGASSQSGERIALGHSDSGPCAIDVRVLASHLCVTGQPGMGKTTAMVRLIAQLVGCGISVVVLEPAKVEYADALRRAGVPATALGFDGESGTATLQTNPFLVDERVLPRAWIQDACTCLEDVYGLKSNRCRCTCVRSPSACTAFATLTPTVSPAQTPIGPPCATSLCKFSRT
ncbi:MAG: DUF87 domain-containing protein [Senegalimassilia faecalis]